MTLCRLEVILIPSNSDEWKTSSCRNLNLLPAAQSIWKYGTKPLAEFGNSTMNAFCLWSTVPDLAVSNFHETVMFACKRETCISQSIMVKAACSNIKQSKKAYLPVAELFSQFHFKKENWGSGGEVYKDQNYLKFFNLCIGVLKYSRLKKPQRLTSVIQ